MKAFLGAVFLLLAVSFAYCQVGSLEDVSSFDYHRRYGIPAAARIKRLEEEYFKSKNSSRVVGGEGVRILRVPYQAGLLISVIGYTSVCGGVLISENRVLTAAHCHSDGVVVARSVTVVLGSDHIFFGGTRIFSNDFDPYPDWNPNLIANDIAIIRIRSVVFSSFIQPIALPNDISESFVGFSGIVSGYGLTADNSNIPYLQRVHVVNVPIVSDNECRAIYGIMYHDSNVCTSGANGMGPCSGDSGGPLAVLINDKRILVGLTSYGHRAGCSAGFPAAYARVSSYLEWIKSQ